MNTTYLITFGRVGRAEPKPATITAASAADLAREIRQIIKPLLRSREFTIDVDLDAGLGLIDGGRFGDFTIAAIGAAR
jgi:hypothetical protein